MEKIFPTGQCKNINYVTSDKGTGMSLTTVVIEGPLCLSNFEHHNRMSNLKLYNITADF
jgi:hypothetical protein